MADQTAGKGMWKRESGIGVEGADGARPSRKDRWIGVERRKGVSAWERRREWMRLSWSWETNGRPEKKSPASESSAAQTSMGSSETVV